MARSTPPRPEDHDGPAWFEPKKVGYGSGLPIAWQGWVLTVAYVVMVTALAPLAARSLFAYLSLFLTITAIFMMIVRKTTPGGWRWRSGREDR